MDGMVNPVTPAADDGAASIDGEEPITRFRRDNFFLSNFFPRAFDMADMGVVPTAEHAYNALKTADAAERDWVLASDSPGEAKRTAAP